MIKQDINQDYKQKAFTLLELLVALSIFSMISVMAYGGLQTVITTKNTTQQVSARIAEVQLVIMRISNDLRQALARKIRDEQGEFVSAMKLDSSSEGEMEWSRAGYRNPASVTRSNIQRVAYKIEKHKLIRMTWPVLDRAQDTEAVQSEVLSNIESIEWRFLNDENAWVSQWPEDGTKADQFPLPKAVEVNLKLEDFGNIRRLIIVANDI
jgi:general secretion pathway protein J